MDHDPINGVLVLDKPPGMSSAAAVDHVKRAFRAKRAGHGGTLDPIATGVLAICLGEATKVAQYLLADDKAYRTELVLGRITDTLDRTGIVIEERDPSGVTRAQIEAALAGRRGEQDQVPPMFSAIKQDGVRLYKQARRGVEVERAPRRIRIDQLELVAFEGTRVTLDIACSKGTYIRSLVDDLGRDLGCGAYLAELRRTRSGLFSIDQAQQLTALDATRLLPIEHVLRLPAVTVTSDLVPFVRSGLQLRLDQLPPVPEVPQFQLIDEAAKVVAIVHADAGKIIYDRVFPVLTSRP
ncbi:MAG TPA: tRNA pseudouridine(55) synthase TruB [Kofleriaceae bacterium]